MYTPMARAMNDDWTSATFRSALVAMVRRRVPDGDVDDVVQAALTEAVATRDRPADPEGARRWIGGVARNKIADYHRRARRETFHVPELATPAAHDAERDLLRWAVGELPAGADAQQTLAWLLREADGERLEEIAAEERLPAPQVRQRVSRLRKLFRARWAQIVAAGLVALALWLAWRSARPQGEMAHRALGEAPEVQVARARGRTMREAAMRTCDEGAWQRCLDALDAAKALDPAGDDAPAVRAARQRAHDAIEREHRAPAPVGDARGFGGLGAMGMDTHDSGGGMPAEWYAARRRRRARGDAGVPSDAR
jgi:RNA polymerase sigma factor (sigma-70 family)